MPRVSICLPTLNGQPLLTERLESILKQTFWDWELIVVDGFSSDGSWEFFQQHAVAEPRIRLAQAPREGVYGGALMIAEAIDGVKESIFGDGPLLVSLRWKEQIELTSQQPQFFDDAQGLRRQGDNVRRGQ